jgi:hypothetical protein
MALPKKWTEVTCARHGKTKEGEAFKPPQVKVSTPTNKRMRTSGCPACRKESNA